MVLAVYFLQSSPMTRCSCCGGVNVFLQGAGDAAELCCFVMFSPCHYRIITMSERASKRVVCLAHACDQLAQKNTYQLVDFWV